MRCLTTGEKHWRGVDGQRAIDTIGFKREMKRLPPPAIFSQQLTPMELPPHRCHPCCIAGINLFRRVCLRVERVQSVEFELVTDEFTLSIPQGKISEHTALCCLYSFAYFSSKWYVALLRYHDRNGMDRKDAAEME